MHVHGFSSNFYKSNNTRQAYSRAPGRWQPHRKRQDLSCTENNTLFPVWKWENKNKAGCLQKKEKSIVFDATFNRTSDNKPTKCRCQKSLIFGFSVRTQISIFLSEKTTT